MDGHFYYYAYGSNLLSERIHLRNPSASFIATAKLEGYKLDFAFRSKSWHGAPATIIESATDHVWGVIWKLKQTDLASLDRQEHVYSSFNVKVTTGDGKRFDCRTYKLLDLTTTDTRPSPQYLDVIQRGAGQHNLPAEYIAMLNSIEHNGYAGKLDIEDEMDGSSNTSSDSCSLHPKAM